MIETFETAILERITGSAFVNTNACTYGNEPAVFFGMSPPDTDTGWNGTATPRIDFQTDWNSSPDRKTSGHLFVNVWCTNQDTVQPEDFAEELQVYLSDAFYQTAGGVFGCQWEAVDSFTVDGNEPQTIGITIDFNVIAFPNGRSGLQADPVKTLQETIAAISGSYSVLEKKTMPDAFTCEDPVIYVRLISDVNAGIDTYTTSWHDCKIMVHVLCNDFTRRFQTVAAIADRLDRYGKLELDNNAPLILNDWGRSVSTESGADPMTIGQITINGRYGVSRHFVDADTPKMNTISVKGSFENV